MKVPDSEHQASILGGDEGERVHAAVIQGSSVTGKNMIYAQDGPMALARVLRGIAKKHVRKDVQEQLEDTVLYDSIVTMTLKR